MASRGWLAGPDGAAPRQKSGGAGPAAAGAKGGF